jgi:hypothetical protein
MEKSEFTEEEFNSNDGMMTNIWGPAMWHFLHTMSFNYPVHPTPKQKKHYRSFIDNLKHILPCGKCRTNLLNNFTVLPLLDVHLQGRESFSRYIFELHNIINKMLCKRIVITYDEVREKYENFRARCSTQRKKEKICHSTTRRDRTVKKKKKNIPEKGCVIPYNGVKQKCILRIVPESTKCKTFV